MATPYTEYTKVAENLKNFLSLYKNEILTGEASLSLYPILDIFLTNILTDKGLFWEKFLYNFDRSSYPMNSHELYFDKRGVSSFNSDDELKEGLVIDYVDQYNIHVVSEVINEHKNNYNLLRLSWDGRLINAPYEKQRDYVILFIKPEVYYTNPSLYWKIKMDWENIMGSEE